MKTALFIIMFLASFGASAQDSLRIKAARMVMIGFEGNTAAQTRDIRRTIARNHIGGVILFSKNINPDNSRVRLRRMCAKLERAGRGELFIAVDQEGGRVSRLNPRNGFGPYPSHQSLGETDNHDTTRYWADRIASDVAAVGININFAPCIDLNVNPQSPAIGHYGRSFSADSRKVSRMAQVFIDAHHSRGVITSLKHYPGHGNAAVDSHLGFTDITETWSAAELEPYKELLKGGYCDIVMVSHLFNSRIDSLYPATLSPIHIEQILRGELGWKGVVATDDMQMRAIVDHYSLEQAVRLSINAGCDMLIFGDNIKGTQVPNIGKTVVDIIVDAVEKGYISAQRIDVSYRRLCELSRRTGNNSR